MKCERACVYGASGHSPVATRQGVDRSLRTPRRKTGQGVDRSLRTPRRKTGQGVDRSLRPLPRRPGTLVVLATVLLTACAPDDGRTPLIVYSPHGPDMLESFESKFEALHPTVDLQWLDMGSQEVLDRIRSEQANPQADIWWGAPAQLFQTAAEEGLLESYAPSWAASVGEHADSLHRYHGIYLTPEVIAYNTDALTEAEAPKDWDDVLDPRWKGEVLIRDPLASGTMRTIFGMILLRSIRETRDTEAGFEWLRQLDAQTKEYVLNPTLMYQKLARQEGLVTLWDMPDIEMLKAKTDYPIDYIFPTSGTPLVVDGLAIVGGAPHLEVAREFVEFIGGEAAVTTAARDFFRLPARNDIPADSLPEDLRAARAELVPEPMNWELLQEKGSDWMRQWDQTVRGQG